MIPDVNALGHSLKLPTVKSVSLGYHVNLLIDRVGWVDGTIDVDLDSGFVRANLRHKTRWFHSTWHSGATAATADAVQQVEREFGR